MNTVKYLTLLILILGLLSLKTSNNIDLKAIYHSQIHIDNSLIPAETLLGNVSNYTLYTSFDDTTSNEKSVFNVRFNKARNIIELNSSHERIKRNYKKGLLIDESVSVSGNASKTRHIYNDSVLSKSILYNSDNSLSGYYTYSINSNQEIRSFFNASDSLIHKTVVTFDLKNNVVKEEYQQKNNKYFTKYHYNKKGILIGMSNPRTSYNIAHTVFDQHGNWTKAEIEAYGKKFHLSRRISYF